MPKSEEKIQYLALAIIVLILFLSFIFYPFNFHQNNITNKWNFNQNKVNLEYGAVLKDGPYGNISSPVKIAYIIGVHPLESKSHRAILETVQKENGSLKYCYYIYRVIVTKDQDDYTKGRINGQILANKYAVPDIKRNDYNLVVDVHSNRGYYEEKLFVFSPIKQSESERIALQIKNRIPWLSYYVPPLLSEPTSGPYVTVPLIKSGIPAIVYEVYAYDSYSQILNYAHDFVKSVDEILI